MLNPLHVYLSFQGLGKAKLGRDQVSQMWVNEVICTRDLCVRGRRLALERPFPPTERSLISRCVTGWPLM